METKNFFTLWYTRALIVLVLVGTILALGAYALATWKESQHGMMGPTTINVQGEGEIFARPDIGEFTFSVTAEAEDATTAQTDSAEAMNAIIAYLTEAGVAEADIQTTNYRLNPQYTWEERVCPAGSFCPPSGERVLTGYEVSQSVVVKVRDLDTAGDLISGVGERGATNVSNLSFTIDDETALMAEARAAAINDAKAKAQQIAEDLDVRLVRMTGYWEERPGQYPQASYSMAMDEARGFGGNVAPEMPVGENRIVSTVTITYEVK